MKIIGEIAQAHDGSLGTAHAMISAIKAAGADAVKFQLDLPAFESGPDEPWRAGHYPHPQDKTRQEYWTRTSFLPSQWMELRAHVEASELEFILSVFSPEGLKFAEFLKVDAIKIPSGRINDHELIRAAAKTGKPLYISTGMATAMELCDTDDVAPEATFMQCTSEYPCAPEHVGMNVLLKSMWVDLPFGLSDHSGTIYPSLIAAWLGAVAAEVHVCLSRECYGPDVTSSITTAELKQLVEGVRFIDKLRENPVDKDAMAEQLSDMRDLFLHQTWRDKTNGEAESVRGDHGPAELQPVQDGAGSPDKT